MALESLTGTSVYIDDLVKTNPVGATDPKSQGDDHIRGIKNVLLNTFPSLTGAVTATQAELNYNDLTTGPGTQEANKTVVADSNVNIGATKVTELHVGASGSEVQMTSAKVANAPVIRDASGAAALDVTGDLTGNVTGNVTGNADTATNASHATNADYATSAGGIGSATIGQTQLKTATGTVSTSTSGNLTLPGGEYGFYPRVWVSGNTGGAYIAESFTSTSATTNIKLSNDGGGFQTTYASQRYIQASPPYKIGDIGWGHFLFILRNKSTGEVRAAYEAQDPPWAYNGPMHLHKDDPELLATIPHPFPEYQGPEGEAKLVKENLEIVLVDMRDMDVNLWMYDNFSKGKQTVLEELSSIAPLGKTRVHTDVGIPEILGFTDKIKIKARV